MSSNRPLRNPMIIEGKQDEQLKLVRVSNKEKIYSSINFLKNQINKSREIINTYSPFSNLYFVIYLTYSCIFFILFNYIFLSSWGNLPLELSFYYDYVDGSWESISREFFFIIINMANLVNFVAISSAYRFYRQMNKFSQIMLVGICAMILLSIGTIQILRLTLM